MLWVFYNGFAFVLDGYEVGDVYGMAGKSPGGQFNYPAFTFPGPQVRHFISSNLTLSILLNLSWVTSVS